jgi:type VI protein secretion system component Hcp
MAVDYFRRIDGIDGESTGARHKGYQVGGSAPEEPLDQGSLRFGRIEVEYTPRGRAARPSGWSRAAGT